MTNKKLPEHVPAGNGILQGKHKPPVAPLPNGPRILFFSGGTALKETAAAMTKYSCNTLHFITPFDSGGSSAVLRQQFGMPAVGDVRARIMALADHNVLGVPEVYTLFSYRFSADESTKKLQSELVSMVRGKHPLLRQIPAPMNGILQDQLTWFALNMPSSFRLQGASIGNLILAAGYLSQNRRLNPVIALYSRMVHAKGIVRPIVETPAHLAVRLASGEVLIGQHMFTGKEVQRITSPIEDIWLVGADGTQHIQVSISPRTAARIRKAECICYPIGSFYSSVVANLLPKGVGKAIAAAHCPKVFIPNLGVDPELLGHTVQKQVEQLTKPLLADAPTSSRSNMVHTVLVDAENGSYPGGLPSGWLAEQGIQLVSMPLVTAKSAPFADAELLSNALVYLAKQNA